MKKLLLLLLPFYCFGQSNTYTFPPSLDTIKVTISRVSAVAVTPPAQPINFVLDTIAATTELNGPGRGFNNFQNEQAFSYSPVTADYARLMMAAIQTGPTSFNWAALDNYLTPAKASNKKVTVRINTVCSSCGSGDGISNGLGYPSFLHTQMQGESVKDWQYSNGTWFPNYQSQYFLNNVDTFNKYMALHIVSAGFDNTVDKIDVGIIGDYGEFQTYGLTEPAGTHPTDASVIRVMNSFKTYFPNKWLIVNQGIFDTRYFGNTLAAFGLSFSNAKGLCGFRYDHISWDGTVNFDKNMMNRNVTVNGVSKNILTEFTTRYKYAPLSGEPMNNVANVTPAGGTPYQSMANEIKYYHLVQISNIFSANDADTRANFDKARVLLGYRYQIKGGQYTPGTASLRLTVNASNVGLTPTYETWQTYIELRTGSTVVYSSPLALPFTLFGPGTQTATNTFTGITAGTYSLYLVVKDPTAYLHNLPFANTVTDGNGGVKLLNSVTIN